MKYDVIIIGSGPGGYVCAIRCAQNGLKTLVIEKETLGGVCLNWGCIPTKSLLESAHLIHNFNSGKLGVTGEITVKTNEIFERSRKIANQLSSGVNSLLHKYKVESILGKAKIDSPGKILLEEKNKVLNYQNLVIATGARAKPLPNLDFNDQIWNYRMALKPPKMPKKLFILGAGPIGLEFADIYSAMGVEVVVAEMQSQILPNESFEVAKTLRKALEKKGIQILTDSKAEIKETKKSVQVKIHSTNKTSEDNFDAALIAIGISANTETLNLEKLGIKSNGFLKVDNNLRAIKNVYGIGDVIGGKALAHKASHEGLFVADLIAGKETHTISNELIPSCVYTSPQVASVGYSKNDLKKNKIPFETGHFPYLASGKAKAIGEDEGFIEVYCDKKTGEILGATMIGPDVTELISTIGLGISAELTTDEFLQNIFPHPTISESIPEAFALSKGKGINF